MLNPFVFAAYPKLEKDPLIAYAEQMAHDQGQTNGQAIPWHQLTVHLGRFLISMGSKLTQEESIPCESGRFAA